MQQWRKPIPESRDRLQSELLVGVGAPLLAIFSGFFLFTAYINPFDPFSSIFFLKALIVSLTFGILVWALRAATPFAAICGAMICLHVMAGTRDYPPLPLLNTGLSPLIGLFVCTFAATKIGKHRNAQLGLEESPRGRNTAQVIANLGIAAFAGIAGTYRTDFSPIILAALCEATADPVSSEIGQAFGGTPYLLTTLRRVPPGTDGAISLLGTVAGTLASGVVALTGLWAMHLSVRQTAIAFVAGLAGLLFDSLLGATLERRGHLGNDLVNFASTLFASALALLLAVS